jgi:hypothetical protein
LHPSAAIGWWRRLSVSPLLLPLTRRRMALQWRLAGRPVPPPHIVKQHIVLGYQRRYRLRTFVETGTYTGEMIAAVRREFDRVISIELDPTLHEAACRRFAGDERVRLLRGDSGQLLPVVLRDLHEPAMFWLDGHYMGAGTGRGAVDSPLADELRALLAHPVRGHVVLIDDARLCVGTDGYPALDDLRSMVASGRPGGLVEVEGDIVRCIFGV